MKNAGGQGGICFSFQKDITEVLFRTCSARCDNGYGKPVGKSGKGFVGISGLYAVMVHTGKKHLARTALLCFLCPGKEFFVGLHTPTVEITPPTLFRLLDIKDGQTVKGTNFVNLRQAGDPVELGRAYSEQGADELVFLDITASHEGRKTFTELVKRIAANINIPFTVGGGINELRDVDRLLNAGADKISINSSAIRNPQLIDDIAKNFGSQVCVLAVDAKQTENGWKCYLNGGRIETDKELLAWTKEAQERGAGEILFTSMNHDGVKTGYANEALASLADQLSIPVIASGGQG